LASRLELNFDSIQSIANGGEPDVIGNLAQAARGSAITAEADTIRQRPADLSTHPIGQTSSSITRRSSAGTARPVGAVSSYLIVIFSASVTLRQRAMSAAMTDHLSYTISRDVTSSSTQSPH
jgi:hypothetical protein